MTLPYHAVSELWTPLLSPPYRCLEEKLDDTDMSKECKDEVTRNVNRMATDYRLNWRLTNACEGEITKLCPNSCSTTLGTTCGGLVLQCLQVFCGTWPRHPRPSLSPKALARPPLHLHSFLVTPALFVPPLLTCLSRHPAGQA